MTHPHVPHPAERIPPAGWRGVRGVNDRALQWISDHVLPSMLMFDVALVIPLLAIGAPDSVKLTVGVISGSWIQWWALHALQRSAVKADVKRDAKADADHEALTHIALVLDEIRDHLSEGRG